MPKALWVQDDYVFVCLYKSNEVALVDTKNFRVLEYFTGFRSPSAVAFCRE